MTMLLRRQMMKPKGGDWRDLYQQVAYLQSSGTQYINTGILLQQGDKVTIKFKASTISSTQTKAIWGYRYAGTYSGTSQAFIQETSTFRGIAAGVPSSAAGVGNHDCFPFDTTNTVVIDSGNNSITVNGSTPAGLNFDLSNGKAFDSSGSSVYSPCLFTFNALGTPNTSVIPSNLSIYEYIVERNSAEIQHFLPCYRKADNEPGMYDTVSGTFFINAGTGEFVVGPATLFHGTLYNGMIGSDGNFNTAVSANRLTNTPNVSPFISDFWLDAGTYTISTVKTNESARDIMSGSVITKSADNVIIDNYARSWNDFPFTFTITQGAYCSFTLRHGATGAISPDDYIPIINKV